MKLRTLATLALAATLAVAPLSQAHAENHHRPHGGDNSTALIAAGITGAVLALAANTHPRTVVVSHPRPVYVPPPVYARPAPVYYYDDYPPVYRPRPVYHRPPTVIVYRDGPRPHYGHY